MDEALQSSICQTPNTCREIPYLYIISIWSLPEAGVSEDVALMDYTIDQTTGTKVLFAFSGGARVAAAWLAEHADDPDAPSPAELSFVVIGNPTRAYGGATATLVGPTMEMPQTQYQVLDIARQYDLISDFPTNPFNLLALANAFVGFVFLHLDYADVDVNDPDNVMWKEGNITYVFVPTQNLPLLEPLRMQGLDWLADALNEPLKQIVELGYDRTYLTTARLAQPSITSVETASALSASAVANPTVVSQDALVSMSVDPQPAPTAEPASPSTRPDEANGKGEELQVIETPTTALSPDHAKAGDPALTAAADSIATAVGPDEAIGTGKGLVVAANTVASTPAVDRADVLNVLKSITPPAARPGWDNAIAARQPTTHTTTTSTIAGNKNPMVTGTARGNQTKTNSDDQLRL
jgi:hypothetical protein